MALLVARGAGREGGRGAVKPHIQKTHPQQQQHDVHGQSTPPKQCSPPPPVAQGHICAAHSLWISATCVGAHDPASVAATENVTRSTKRYHSFFALTIRTLSINVCCRHRLPEASSTQNLPRCSFDFHRTNTCTPGRQKACFSIDKQPYLEHTG